MAFVQLMHDAVSVVVDVAHFDKEKRHDKQKKLAVELEKKVTKYAMSEKCDTAKVSFSHRCDMSLCLNCLDLCRFCLFVVDADGGRTRRSKRHTGEDSSRDCEHSNANHRKSRSCGRRAIRQSVACVQSTICRLVTSLLTALLLHVDIL